MERLEALLATLLRGGLLGFTRSEVAILVKCVRVFQLSQVAQRHVCLAPLLLQLVELLSQPFVLLLQLSVAGCVWSLLDTSGRRFTCVGRPASLLIALFDLEAELGFIFLVNGGPRVDQLLHKFAPINVSHCANVLRCRSQLDEELVRRDRFVLIFAIQLLSEEHLHFNLVLMSDDTLAWPNQVSVGLGRLDLEHDWNVAFVDQLDRARGTVTFPRPETYMSDWIQCHALPPVLVLRW